MEGPALASPTPGAPPRLQNSPTARSVAFPAVTHDAPACARPAAAARCSWLRAVVGGFYGTSLLFSMHAHCPIRIPCQGSVLLQNVLHRFPTSFLYLFIFVSSCPAPLSGVSISKSSPLLVILSPSFLPSGAPVLYLIFLRPRFLCSVIFHF